MIAVVGPLELFAALAAGLFSGASIYINLVEHPARIQCGTALALAQFAPQESIARRSLRIQSEHAPHVDVPTRRPLSGTNRAQPSHGQGERRRA